MYSPYMVLLNQLFWPPRHLNFKSSLIIIRTFILLEDQLRICIKFWIWCCISLDQGSNK